MTTYRHRVRPGFVVLVLTCAVYFALGWCAAGSIPSWSAAPPRAEMPVANRMPGHEDEEANISTSETPWYLVLVNRDHPLQTDPQISLTALRNGQSVDARIYSALQAMMDDARAAGLSPLICSSYRTEARQNELFEDKVQEYRMLGYSRSEAETEAAQWVAPPGTSEHQTGLAVDIVAESNQHLDSTQEDTAEQQWLMEHCWEYGFILRYPEEKSRITGISYEPWHYRYVGLEAAQAMKESGECLEEYLDAA